MPNDFLNQIAVDARDVCCNPDEFGVKVKHTVRDGPSYWRVACVQVLPPDRETSVHMGRRVLHDAQFFMSVLDGEGIARPKFGDTLETDGPNGRVYNVMPTEDQEAEQVGEVMVINARAYSDDKIVAVARLRQPEG